MIGKKYFLNAVNGSFSTIPKQGEPGTYFSEVTGRLVNIRFKHTKAGEVMRLYIIDELNFYIISMFVRSRMANVIFLSARNLDLHQPLTLRLKKEIDPRDKRLKDFLSVFQFGDSVRWAFDKSNLNELPADDEEKRTYLRAIVENETIPHLAKLINPYPSHPFYRPFGSGNGIDAGYFGTPGPKLRPRISDSEIQAAGYSSYREYMSQNKTANAAGDPVTGRSGNRAV